MLHLLNKNSLLFCLAPTGVDELWLIGLVGAGEASKLFISFGVLPLLLGGPCK